MKKKILFISHDASRTGAPIVLLHLLNWIKIHSNLEFLILLKNGGELDKEFEKIGETVILNKIPAFPETFVYKVIRKIDNRLQLRKRNVLNKLKKFNPSLIFANSAATSDVVIDICRDFQVPVIFHIHELEISISQFAGKSIFEGAINIVTRFIAVSKAVSNNLINNFNIPENKISIVHEFIHSIPTINNDIDFYKDLNIPKDAFVVAGSGTMDWRKGPDLFIQVAYWVNQLSPNLQIYFIWIGGTNSGVEYEKLKYDVNKLQLNSKVLFLGSRPRPVEYFSNSDLFLLTSREDPFPLVCLEAASVGKPIICFNDAGGMSEFVERGCGIIVPYLNCKAMAEAIITLSIDKVALDSYSHNAKLKVKDYDVSYKAREILDIINSI